MEGKKMNIYKTLFKASNLNQNEIADKLGMTQQNVSNKQKDIASLKHLSVAMQKLNINLIEAKESGLSIKIERL